MRYARQALAYAERHEVHAFASYIGATIAWLRLRAGAWDEAERDAQREIERGITVAQLLAKTVLAELAVRRGDADAPAGSRTSPSRPTAPASCSGWRRFSSWCSSGR